MKRVYILGGTAAMGVGVDDQLEALGYEVTRLGGATRIETSLAIAAELRHQTGGRAVPQSLVVSAGNWPDAVMAGAVASRYGIPILLTHRDELPGPVRQYFVDNPQEQIYVIGGMAVVGTPVLQDLQGLTIPPTDDQEAQCFRFGGGNEVTPLSACRWAGQTRTGTALAVSALANRLSQQLGKGVIRRAVAVNLRRDNAFAYINAASTIAGAQETGTFFFPAEGDNGSILDPLLARELCQAPPDEQLGSALFAVDRVTVVGGTDLVSDRFALTVAAESACSQDRRFLLVDPNVTQTAGLNGGITFRVPSLFDERPVDVPVTAALIPCASRQIVNDREEFTDDNNDGLMDQLGTTDAGSARIIGVNGSAIQPTGQVVIEPGGDGLVQLTMQAPAEDCAVVVLWLDDNDGQLAMADSKVVIEPYNSAIAVWRNG